MISNLLKTRRNLLFEFGTRAETPVMRQCFLPAVSQPWLEDGLSWNFVCWLTSSTTAHTIQTLPSPEMLYYFLVDMPTRFSYQYRLLELINPNFHSSQQQSMLGTLWDFDCTTINSLNSFKHYSFKLIMIVTNNLIVTLFAIVIAFLSLSFFPVCCVCIGPRLILAIYLAIFLLTHESR